MYTLEFVLKSLVSFSKFLANKEKSPTLSTYKPLKLDLQFFADGGDGGDGGDDGGDGGDGGSGKDDEPFATFKSKDEFDKRLSRAERKGQKELAKTLGFDSVEAMQEAISKKDDKKKDNQKDKKDDPVDVDSLVEEKLKAEREKTFARLRNSEVKIQAKELGFADWEDALALADLSDVKEDDKGNIVGVKESLEELAKKKPHLLKAKSSSFGGNIPKSQAGSTKSLEDIKKMAQSRNASTNSAYNPWAK
jgi:hypothetical protein